MGPREVRPRGPHQTCAERRHGATSSWRVYAHTKLNSMACLREGLLATTHTSSSSASLLVQRHTLSVSRSPRRGALQREGTAVRVTHLHACSGRASADAMLAKNDKRTSHHMQGSMVTAPYRQRPRRHNAPLIHRLRQAQRAAHHKGTATPPATSAGN